MPETQIIDGKAIAQQVRSEVKVAVDLIREKWGKTVTLAVILVGERRDSATYVSMKNKACVECGIKSRMIKLPDTSTQEEIEGHVARLNADNEVDGILVQLPLPSHIDEPSVLKLIDWHKDVDGLHPTNIGHLALRDHEPCFKPCTAKGIVELLKRSKVDLPGKTAVVVGRSNIVGMPVSLLLQQENCTVIMCHSRTKNLSEVVKQGDIVIAAIGKPKFINADWLKEGCVVIDVGINSVDDPTMQKGYRLVGDCDYQSCFPKCSLITPVPGGVGPMTVALLVQNASASRILRLAKNYKDGILSTEWPFEVPALKFIDYL
eukprot:Filipodium_phascolosomae@DN8047_c0_g1_i1.p1